MKFTIVTPSFNQAAYLPKTLASIENQTLKDYEHLIFDPGSTDGSLDIAREYCGRHAAATLFEGRDQSQTHAINLGYAEAQGDIVCWLNSDDRYASHEVLEKIASEFHRRPDVDIIYGLGIYVDSDGEPIKKAFVHRNADVLRGAFSNALGILQPSLFMRRSVFERVGPLDQRMNYSFDYEYWARCASFGMKFFFLDEVLSEAVIHEDAKTIRARAVSLAESTVVAKRYYDFLSLDWIKRVVDQELSGADGITAQSSSIPEDKIRTRFIAENNNSTALSRYFNNDSMMNDATRSGFVDWVLPTIERAYISAWDANYFDMGVTLVASIHRFDPDILIFIGDIGMTCAQKAFVRQLKNVIFLEESFPAYQFEWQRNPKNYVFKNVIFNTLANCLGAGTLLLWVDAGVVLCKSPHLIFEKIRLDGHFFVDHDDSRHWPLFNASFTSDAAIREGGFTWHEMASPHVCSCLFGVKTGSDSHELFLEAEKLAQIQGVAVGDKHPPESLRRLPLPKTEQADLAKRMHDNLTPVNDIEELRRVFGYWGHRQDQSIISALVARARGTISSARSFCPANDESSVVSKENWFDGVSQRLGNFRRNDFNLGGVTFHHRGLVKDFSGLQFSYARKAVCAILGNGPSLADIDFSVFLKTDAVGMNAAYRYWKEIDWYPTIYSCLDTVVGMSHKEAILDLVRHRKRLGIEQFLIRQNLFDWLAEEGEVDGVVCFDLVRYGFAELLPEPVTTGSHALAWASSSGYDRFVIAGVDCNYVEQFDGSKKTDHNILEIAADGMNPNSSSGYQKVGDKDNIPNPSKDLHIRGWRNVGVQLNESNAIINVSAISRMDAFPKLPIDVALRLLGPESHFDEKLIALFRVMIAKNSEAITSDKAAELEQLRANYASLEAHAQRLEGLGARDVVKKPPRLEGAAAGDAAGAARWFLWSFASQLLTKPREALLQLNPAAGLDKTIDLRLKELPKDDPVAIHFRSALDFARARAHPN